LLKHAFVFEKIGTMAVIKIFSQKHNEFYMKIQNIYGIIRLAFLEKAVNLIRGIFLWI